MKMRTIDQIEIKNKKILMRVDYNVPFNRAGEISDDSRIRENIPTLRYLLSQGGAVILMSHLGNPDLSKGEESLSQYSLAPICQRLSQLIGREVLFIESSDLERIKSDCSKLQPGQIALLNNLRFHPGEKKPAQDPSFANLLHSLADTYVNDAFAAAHRKHTSVTEVAKLFKEHSVAGFLMEREVRFLSEHLLQPQRPFMAVIGGAKISSKIGILEKLLDKCDGLAIVGAMAFTFLKAQGFDIGDSLYEEEFIPFARDMLNKAASQNKDILLPEDALICQHLNEISQTVLMSEGIPEGWRGVDIGERTISRIYLMLQRAKTLFWNGPAGIFEIEAFSFGTRAIANLFASHPHTTIVGGGDSAAALKLCQVEDKIDHVSTGGGACLEFIEKETLPGIEELC